MRALADDTLLTAYTLDATTVPASGTWVRRLRYAGVLCGVWAIPGVIAGLSLAVLGGGPNDPLAFSLQRALIWQTLAWLSWAPWSALIIWVVRRMPFRRGDWGRAALVHLGIVPWVVVAQLLWAVALERFLWPGGVPSPFGQHFRQMALRLTDFQVVTYMAVLAAGVALEYFRRYRESLFAAERLRTEMVQAQLLALRSQLNPHFLFNALNAVISLMDRDVPAAQRMVARIGELLRLSLGADEAEVPLSRELALVNQYLEIERIRFGDRLTFRVDVPPDLLERSVPNLMLQPLVENAIVHGVGPRPGPGSVTVEARRSGEQLVLRVVDDGLGIQHAGGGSGHGIGVRNTRARLEALYGDEASLQMRTVPSGGCVAEIRLPLQRASWS
jgi:signal transduction histidine kinase